MLLALDIGNSHVKLGGFCGDDMQFVASIATDERKTGAQYACELTNIFALYHIPLAKIDGLMLCSVVPAVTPLLELALSLLFTAPILTLSAGVKTGLNIKYDQPRTLGSDLVANAVWAAKQGKLPCVVADCGTVTTFTALSKEGALVGTTIAAGLALTLDAMKRGAAQLPTVQLEAPPHGVLGHSTADAMRSGAIFGAAAMIDGLLARFIGALGAPVAVWLTGGSAALIAPHLLTPHALVSQITLRGLAQIWVKNRIL